MDLKEVAVLGAGQDQHWYYASKSRALLKALDGRQPRRILDVGAGSGFFSRFLLGETSAADAICVDPGYAADSLETHAGKPLAFRRTGQAGDADLVLMMDVIEHVDDDVGLVRQYAANARPGTRFVVSVPAFGWLWSQHDDFLEHRRRYTLKQLLRVLADAGLSPVSGFYFFATVFPAVAAQRLWTRWRFAAQTAKSDLRRHHPLTNALLTRLCRAECGVARHNRAFGLTAFGVAEKV
jgi:SAM-dependent methyltransferase